MSKRDKTIGKCHLSYDEYMRLHRDWANNNESVDNLLRRVSLETVYKMLRLGYRLPVKFKILSSEEIVSFTPGPSDNVFNQGFNVGFRQGCQAQVDSCQRQMNEVRSIDSKGEK